MSEASQANHQSEVKLLERAKKHKSEQSEQPCAKVRRTSYLSKPASKEASRDDDDDDPGEKKSLKFFKIGYVKFEPLNFYRIGKIL